MRRRQVLSHLLASAAIAVAGPAVARGVSPRKPNFIVIYCDDLGYGDIGPMGGRDIPTPRLDRMAREGITLTDYYSPANVCSPSRAGLLTGKYPVRTTLSRVLLLPDKTGLPLDEPTIGKTLGAGGYATALIGKWHLGHVEPFWPPTKYGFDLFHGIPYSHDIEPLTISEYDRSGKVGEWQPDFPTLQQDFCARAERFISANRDRPFFLELALSAPHLPNYPAPGFEGKSAAAGAYGDCVMEVDAIVGRVLDRLRHEGIDEETLVIFTSDNGPWFEGSTGGMRERKGGGAYDGGSRVPFVARWPRRIPAGVRSDALASGIDIFPTLCAMAGVAAPQGIDGKDLGGVLLHRAASAREELLLFQNETPVGVRTQRWKFVGGDFYMGYFVPYAGRGYPQLYDMRRGGEQYSVASLHPDVARALQRRFDAAVAEFAPFRRPDSPQVGPMGPPRHESIPVMWRD